jgi:hypothetical protein
MRADGRGRSVKPSRAANPDPKQQHATNACEEQQARSEFAPYRFGSERRLNNGVAQLAHLLRTAAIVRATERKDRAR